MLHGRYLLPAEVSKFSSQPAEADVALNAPDAGDFWVADSPNRLSGPLQLRRQIQWKQETANGASVALRFESADARFGFAASQHAVFGFKQRGLSERSAARL